MGARGRRGFPRAGSHLSFRSSAMADQVGIWGGCPRRLEVLASDEVDLDPDPDLAKNQLANSRRKNSEVQHERLQLRRGSPACAVEHKHHAGSTCARGLVWRAHFTTRADIEEAVRCPLPSAPVTDEPSSRGGSPKPTEHCPLPKSRATWFQLWRVPGASSAENGGGSMVGETQALGAL